MVRYDFCAGLLQGLCVGRSKRDSIDWEGGVGSGVEKKGAFRVRVRGGNCGFP